MKKFTVQVHLDFVTKVTVEAANESEAIDAAEYIVEGMTIREMNCEGNFGSVIE